MKITCTQEERDQLIISMAGSVQCPFAETEGHSCDGTTNCRRCIDEGFEWEIVKGGETE